MTAVEWLVEKLNKSIGLTKFVDTCDEDYKQEILGIIKQALKMEREQILKAQQVQKGDYCAVCGCREFWNDEEE